MKLQRNSQHGEEAYLEKYLGDIEKGTYVDIGSGEPDEISNTYALYQAGWSGVLVEPYYPYHDKIRRVRSRDKLCTKVITDRVGKATMYDTAAVGTFIGNDYQEKKFCFDGSQHERYEADCYTMKEFMEEYPEVMNADFASIDIETGEEALFSKCNFNLFKPKLMCVEYMVRGVDYRPNWEHYLLPFYEPKEVITGNAFYLRKS